MNLDALISRANERLSELGLDQIADGRVAGLFNVRNVRFLRQLGAVSRPHGQGPAATWGGIHVSQLVAVRALQSAGLRLEEAQRRIAGIDEQGLERLITDALSKRSRTPVVGAEPVSAWQITPDFLLVCTRRVALPPEKLARIRAILASAGG